MTTYIDMEPCDYFGPSLPSSVVAVAWLGGPVHQPDSPPSPVFFDALTALLVDPWQPCAFPGRFPCELCLFSGGPGELSYGGRTIRLGTNNLFVADEDRVYVAPSLIAHYIDAHGYRPPDVFQRAVLACPPMKSVAYLASIGRHGMRRLAAPVPAGN
jgi:hypothetical protein